VLPAVTATYFAAGGILRVVGDALDNAVVVSHGPVLGPRRRPEIHPPGRAGDEVLNGGPRQDVLGGGPGDNILVQ
jgi:hypothetical protein